MNNDISNELWNVHAGLSRAINPLIDLQALQVGRAGDMFEIEKKFRLPEDGVSIDEQMNDLFTRIGGMIKRRKLKVKKVINFVGIDQYYVFTTTDGAVFNFRYRSGANRPPQLTVKFKTSGSNLVRGEINLKVDTTSPENIRAFMSVIAVMTPSPPVVFAIRQSGIIWIVEDVRTQESVEIVAYKVERMSGDPISRTFVEIEALNPKDQNSALALISKYEKVLQLSEHVCSQSISEMFAPA